MWIYTRDGFTSVRASAFDKDSVLLRFRTLRHAENYANACGVGRIQESHDTDYRYRFEVSRRVFANVMDREIQDLDYPNFKAAAAATGDDDYVSALHRTWGIHYDLQQSRKESTDEG